MAEQNRLTLLHGLQASVATAGARLLTIVKSVIDRHGPKKRVVIADEIGIKDHHLTDALNGNGKHFAVTWLPAVARYDLEHEIAGEVARWHDLRVLPRRIRTAREQLARYDRVLNRLGRTGDAIRAEAELIPEEEFSDEDRR